ncbi:hypothetical protein L7F22_023890 [Adiantum nelumboides]|nr:hypothetical protein [Adiantum nelumboides]
MTIEGWLELGVKCLSHRHTLIGWCRTILERAHNQEVSPKSTSTSERNIVNVQGMDALDPSDLHPHAIPITYERIFRPDECKHLFPIVGKPFLKKHWPQQHNAYCKGMDEIRGWCKKGLPGNMGVMQFSHVNLRKDKELKKALKAWIAKRIGLLPILYFGKDLKYAWDIHDAYLKVIGWRNYKRYKAPEPSEPLPILEVSNGENNLINDPMRRFKKNVSNKKALNFLNYKESLMPQDQSMAYFTPKHVMLDVSDGEEYEVAPLGTGSLVELITKGLHMPMKEMPTTIQGVSQSINKIGPINAPSFENLYTHGKESSPLLDHCEDDSTLPSCETIPKFSSLSEILENVLDRGKKYKKSLGKAKGMGECKEITMVDMDIEAMEAIAVEGMHLADIDEMGGLQCWWIYSTCCRRIGLRVTLLSMDFGMQQGPGVTHWCCFLSDLYVLQATTLEDLDVLQNGILRTIDRSSLVLFGEGSRLAASHSPSGFRSCVAKLQCANGRSGLEVHT